MLISEEPLMVLPSLALEIGLEEAMFLQQLHYWIRKSKHEHDGRIWIYNTFAEWQAQFPFWSLPKMQRIAARLISLKLITVCKFKKGDYDRTNWYSIDYDAVNHMTKDAPAKLLPFIEKRDEVAKRRARRFTGALSRVTE